MTSPQPLTSDTAFSPHDQKRFRLVAPRDWQNPTPQDKYDLVVIGAGSAGLVTAAGAAGVGAKVALIERHTMGGDCLNVGCVPSKGVVRAARAIAAAQHGAAFGVEAQATFDFATAMERMRAIRGDISEVDSARRFQDELGVDVFLGDAGFQAGGTVMVDDATELNYAKAVIATGARAATPPIKGLAEVGYYTNETIFDLQELPRRMFVLGGGPIGCELAQAFARFGVEVTLADVADRIMNNDDADAAALVADALVADGVRLQLGVKVAAVANVEGQKRVTLEREGVRASVETDAILVAAGRKPNSDRLGLDAVGVEVDPRGYVKVDARLRTSNRRIFACGDIAMPYQFTHVADATARIVIQNALFFGRKKWTDLVVPWVTYTDPEVAHVGKTQQQLKAAQTAYDEFKIDLDDVDRALLDGDTRGYVSILVGQGGEQILGATIVARHAGEMINEVTLAMQQGIGLGGLANVIHPYPTQAEGIRKAADAYNRTRLTPMAAKFLKFLLWFNR